MTDQIPEEDPATIEVERRLVRDLLLAWALDRSGVIVSKLAHALLERDIESAMEQLGLEHLQNVLSAMKEHLDHLREEAWADVVHELPAAVRSVASELSLGAAEVKNPILLANVRRLDLSRITAITDETRNALRAVIQQGLDDGIHPYVLAKQIQQEIGLNRPQVRALAKYRNGLIADGVKPDTIVKKVAARTKVMINQRARTIARTEVARAQQEGSRLRYQSLVNDGTITASEWQVRYVTREDEKVCPICGPLDGQLIPIGGLFVTTEGMLPGPPVHVNCRCITRIVSKRQPTPLPIASLF